MTLAFQGKKILSYQLVYPVKSRDDTNMRVVKLGNECVRDCLGAYSAMTFGSHFMEGGDITAGARALTNASCG